MKSWFKVTILIVFCVFLIRCDKHEITSRDYPRLKTLDVSNISEKGAKFDAEIFFRGAFEIIRFGFVWSEPKNPELGDSDKVVYSENIQSDKFSAEISTTLKVGVTYNVRSFVQTADYLVYGNNIEFLSLGSKAPHIVSFRPQMATIGDTISISGEHFSFIINQNKVKFNSYNSEVVFATDTLLKVIVPTDLKSKSSNLSAGIFGNNAVSDQSFILSTPDINLFNPDRGTDYSEVLIQGDGFSHLCEYNIVRFGEIKAVVLQSSKSLLRVLVPVGVKEPTVELSVSVADQITIAGSLFSILPPVILDFQPQEASIRESITIEGENFGTIIGANLVFFDTAQATITKCTNSLIEAEVPYGVPLSNSKIKIIISTLLRQQEIEQWLYLDQISAHG
jgi:hypothetical protein